MGQSCSDEGPKVRSSRNSMRYLKRDLSYYLENASQIDFEFAKTAKTLPLKELVLRPTILGCVLEFLDLVTLLNGVRLACRGFNILLRSKSVWIHGDTFVYTSESTYSGLLSLYNFVSLHLYYGKQEFNYSPSSIRKVSSLVEKIVLKNSCLEELALTRFNILEQNNLPVILDNLKYLKKLRLQENFSEKGALHLTETLCKKKYPLEKLIIRNGTPRQGPTTKTLSILSKAFIPSGTSQTKIKQLVLFGVGIVRNFGEVPVNLKPMLLNFKSALEDDESHLEDLTLMDFPFTVEEFDFFLENAAQYKNLKALNLNSNSFIGRSKFIQYLGNIPNLRTLFLRGIGLTGDSETKELLSRLCGHATLEELTLSSNMIDSESSQLGILTQHSSPLRKLIISSCRIPDDLVFSGLSKNEDSHLEDLFLSSNRIKSISNLHHLRNLRYLLLGDNSINDFRPLWIAMQKGNQLEVLVLSRNPGFVKAKGHATGFKKALLASTSLSKLSIDETALNDLNALALAESLSETHLRKLSLGNNPLLPETIISILNSLVSNTRLRDLGMYKCLFSGRTSFNQECTTYKENCEIIATEVEKLLSQNETLEELNVTNIVPYDWRPSLNVANPFINLQS